MKKPLALLAVAVSATFAAFADTTATYTTGDTSLEDGKVTIAYDGSDKITSLSLNPASGETLTLTGDTLPFAADAVISPGMGGNSVISNAFTTAGALELSGTTNMTWTVASTDRGLRHADYVTLFENMSIDEIVPVAGTGANRFINPAPDQGPIVVADTIVRGETGGVKWMKFEIQDEGFYDNNKTIRIVRCAYVSLIQNGSNVQGKLVALRYVRNDSTYMTSEELYKSKYGQPMFQSTDGIDTYSETLPYDGCRDYANFYDPDNTGNWGIASITVGRIYGNLTFVLSEDVTLPAISGGGVEVTFEAKESAAEGMTKSFTRGLNSNSFVTMFENVSIDDITLVSVEGASGFVSPVSDTGLNVIESTILRGETAGEQWMKFEVQSKGIYHTRAEYAGTNIVKSAYISLRQKGSDVDGKLLGFSYIRNDQDAALYESAYGNAIFESTDGAEGYSRKAGFKSYTNILSDDAGSSGWGVKSLTVTGPRGYKVTASGANTMTDSSFVVKGDGKNKIVYDVAAKYALPPTFDCYGNATLKFSVAGATNDGAGKGTDAITMHEGTTLRTTVDYPFQYDQTKVVLDGATMIGDGSGTMYCNYMTLMNGAEIVKNNSDYHIGWNAPSPVWTVTGTGRSVYSGELQLWGTNGGTKDTTIEVGETAEGTDFLLDGNLAQSSGIKYPRAALIKTGVGTMEVTGTITLTTRGVYLKEGTLLLSKNDGLAAGTFFTMEGGTLALAENVADACASMSVTEDSALDLAAGASLTLGTVTVAESKTLSITAADGAKVKVNGTLDAATLSRIRLNGHRVMQSADGYLGTPGFMLIVL